LQFDTGRGRINRRAEFPLHPISLRAFMTIIPQEAKRTLAASILLGIILTSSEIASAGDLTSRFNVQVQTACEAELLVNIDAHEIFSGKEYDVLTKVARA
jgi:hypothetical protein